MALVESLLNLHRVDAQVRGLRSRLDTAQRHLSVQTKQLGDLQQQHQELQTRRKHLQAAIATLEVEVKAIDERLEKLRNELNSAVTNKQYSAVLAELNTVKSQRAGIEDRMLADMELLEKLQEQFAALDVQIAERTKIRDHAQAQLEERKSDVGQRLSELETERREAAAVVPPPALAVFDEMADHYQGEAMSPVEVIDRRSREYACGECNMQLPFDLVASLLGRQDSLVRCPSCQRILYLPQESMAESIGKK